MYVAFGGQAAGMTLPVALKIAPSAIGFHHLGMIAGRERLWLRRRQVAVGRRQIKVEVDALVGLGRWGRGGLVHGGESIRKQAGRLASVRAAGGWRLTSLAEFQSLIGMTASHFAGADSPWAEHLEPREPLHRLD